MGEPMDFDEMDNLNDFDNLLEDGECEESHRVSRTTIPNIVESKIEHVETKKSNMFVTGVDIFSKEAKLKANERAKRFGISQGTGKNILNDAENLYVSFGIDIHSESAKNYTLNALHMRGIENLTTKDIFKYFEDYAPASVERISKISCNVIWLDNISAARALLGLSKKIEGIKNEYHQGLSDADSEEDPDELIVNGKLKRDDDIVHIKDIRCPLPHGIWRKGQNYMESRNIFLRFATPSDKQLIHAKQMAGYKSQYERQDKGIVSSSRKHRLREERENIQTASVPSTEDSPKMEISQTSIPKNGAATKNPWGTLSENWGVTDFVEDDYLPKSFPETNVRERLGIKRKRGYNDGYNPNVIVLSDDEEYQRDEYDNSNNENGDYEYCNRYNSSYDDRYAISPAITKPYIKFNETSQSDGSVSDEEDWHVRNKFPRMRMHADDEEKKVHMRIGQKRNHRTSYVSEIISPISPNKDLRKKLIAKRKQPRTQQEPIQVIVANPIAVKSNFNNVILTEDEEDDDEIERDPIVEEVEEDGEIIDDSDEDTTEEYDDNDDEIKIETEKNISEDEATYSESDSNSYSNSSESCIEKEVQGSKGSVIKKISQKPRLQSTVSSVLNRLSPPESSYKSYKKSRNPIHEKKNYQREKRKGSPKYISSSQDLRHRLPKTDLRLRIGVNNKRNRSPLRIELRNDKYSARHRDSN
ncbi:hypothetical protein TKK_0013277 [Trichogramma kaykai]|uniref:Nuclear cap-binding protein subunit 3 n=1 Tax=Trichogramma kaykai TaxID=54128 RepID=A0ABD2WJU9_9HYME